MKGSVALGLVLVSGVAFADDERCVDVQFTPTDKLQLVAWLETASGAYVDTVFITQQTGTFGLGNRPGRFDFNSGPNWPYGRRITTFPVWSHRHGMQFPMVMFQNDTTDDPTYCQTLATTAPDYGSCGENDLSHDFSQSSVESHYCRPLMDTEPAWDTATCPSQAFTDKGKFSMTATTGYPPRVDLVRSPSGTDSLSVNSYKANDPFDAVSQPTPVGGTPMHAGWPVPSTLAAGDYVLWVETSKEFDINTTYSIDSYGSPAGIPWSSYGDPYRGQPSVVYRVPFTINASATTATTTDYAGYGDPDGNDGTVRPPDMTITTDTPGSGGARLELVSDGNDMFRVRVDVELVSASDLPGSPGALAPTAIGPGTVSMSFLAPGVGMQNTQVSGYDIRYRASDEMTPDNFDDSTPATVQITPTPAGQLQTFDLTGLLPQTDYWIGVRAFDSCHNSGALAIAKLTTTEQTSGAVDACFVATAAYGSVMANDVELLRHFRDSLLQSNVPGELGVEAYYTFGPAIAGVVGQSDVLRTSARDALAPLVAWIRHVRF